MCELSPEFITAILTILMGVLIFIIQNLFIIIFIKPYDEFKEAKSKVKYLLRLNKNIYTNSFDSKETTIEFKEYVQNSQKDLRKEWANLYVKYENLLFKFKLPKSKMNEIFDNLIYISNVCIVGSSQNKQTPKGCNEISKKIDSVIELLK